MKFYDAKLVVDDHENAMQSPNIKWWPTSDGKCLQQGYILLNIFFKKGNGWGKGEKKINVGGINEMILHPTSSVWGKGENNSMLGELMR